MARHVWLFCALVGATRAKSGHIHNEAPSCQFLQTHVSLTDYLVEGGHNETMKGICVPRSNLTMKDLADPIMDVSARYDQDGWCVFGSEASWARDCAVARRTRNVNNFALAFEPFYSPILNSSTSTPFTFRLFDGRTLVVRDHVVPCDDLYCFVNNWYDLPRAEVVKNFTFLEEVSDKWCKHLEKIVPNFFGISFNDLMNESLVDESFLLNLEKDGATSGDVPEWVVNGMYLHAAAKCLLRGGNKGALCDIANCAERACFGEDRSTLLYTTRGECTKVAFKQ
ncbi:unnamed protein product [Durusdinium trenchii]|uniref:Uncharacterized protein n=1 Tax=Durusdinium trenchii TaxID=1381693 RepID=A0ABP0L254_9DINO